jgi:cytochrome c oxidase assembly factor CtaG
MSSAAAPGWGSWSFNPIVIVVLIAAAIVYARVYRRAEQRAGSSKPGIGQWLPYSAGLFAIAIALLSPLDAIGDCYLLRVGPAR